ncbi:MAG: hypothetical protein PF440_02995 [Thiomicrorhabdus sp.]|jgi:DNA polymerase elongation subunit (family B)|nr:hypothetical protein [Thiomicrorhabdus sp.]
MDTIYEDFEGDKNRVWSFNTESPPQFQQYDLHSLIAADTDSAYIRLPIELTDGLEPDEITIVCDEIGDMLNQTFPDFIQRVFNCPDSRRDTIQTDREAISDKSLFLSKKRYVMHIIDMEGQKCDKLKIMGVEIKKSNTSTITKRFLMELVNMILDNEDMNSVLERIKSMKTEMYDAPIQDIATSMNCKTLKKCEDSYELTGSMKGFHYSAKAAIVYNLKCGTKDRKIRPGDKIALYYVKDGKNKSIAFPLEINSIPQWLSDIPVDRDVMWEKAHKTITNYLASMGWDIKSRKSELKQQLFGF